MKIYQSSLGYKTLELLTEYAPDIKVNILRSFRLNDDETFAIIRDFKDNIDSIILDSGVWSKHNNPQKYNHTVEEYADFLNRYGQLFEFCFSYDEDFDEKERDVHGSRNRDNQLFLEKTCTTVQPVPVIHLLENEEVDFYCQQSKKYSIVAIGSNAISDQRFSSVVKTLYENDIKVHAFKIGSADKLKGLHAWSSDCSSHAQWTAAGRCVFYDSNNGKDATVSFRPLDKKGIPNDDYYQIHHLLDDFMWFLEEYVSIEIDILIKDSNYRTMTNSIYFWWLEKYLSNCNEAIVPKFIYQINPEVEEFINYLFKEK
uniref:Uncharacterized protein n=1 Tax=Desulfovibrio sp. U5L TaxID=596152 RepID=I2PWX4_9BACT